MSKSRFSFYSVVGGAAFHHLSNRPHTVSYPSRYLLSMTSQFLSMTLLVTSVSAVSVLHPYPAGPSVRALGVPACQLSPSGWIPVI